MTKYAHFGDSSESMNSVYVKTLKLKIIYLVFQSTYTSYHLSSEGGKEIEALTKVIKNFEE